MRPALVSGRSVVDARFLPDLSARYKPFLVAASQTELTIREGTMIKIINGNQHTMLRWDEDTTFAVADYLDTGVIEAGKDYYVYVCEDGQEGNAKLIEAGCVRLIPGEAGSQISAAVSEGDN